MSNQIARFRVDGLPVTQGSKNAYPTKKGKVNVVETRHKELKTWRSLIAWSWKAQRAPQVPGTVSVSLRFFLARPANHYRTGRYAGELKEWAPYYVGKKPDIDKLERAILDALTLAGAIEDDARVAILNTQKLYANTPEQQGVDITIAAID